MKFNYRSSEERNINYPEVFQLVNHNDKRKFAPKSQIRIKKLKENINQFANKVAKEVR